MGYFHSHNHSSHVSSYRLLIIAVLVIAGFAAVEFIAGWMSNSLALLSDAGHMGSDALALLIAAFAAWISEKPPSIKHSYGLGRAEVLAAWVSSLLMIVVSIAIVIEAVERIHSPEFVNSPLVILVAFLGMLVNLSVAWLLLRQKRSLNIRAALLHVMGDWLGSMAALISGAVIYFTHWFLIDPILSILIGILILFSSLSLLRESLLVLMEGVPRHISYHEVSHQMRALEGIQAVHDLHIWTLSSGKIVLSAHVTIQKMQLWPTLLEALQKQLEARFSISHMTLQPESTGLNCKRCDV